MGTGRQNVLNAFATCGAFRELSGTLYREANWLVADHLGTPRMIVNKSGTLASVKRHDYLPFGEELFAGTGGRSFTQGYAGDSVRQKFTQKERDNETGLDYFGARYYSSTQGRFISPDRLLSSGRVEDPQTWNRYNYVLDNPLKFSDPLGLFEYGPGTTKEQIKRIDQAYKDLEKARDHYKKGSKEYNAIDRSLGALGAPGTKNGVTVQVDNSLRTPGRTDPSFTYDSGDKVKGAESTVTLNLSKFANDGAGNADLAGALGHEGTHVADGQSDVQSLIGKTLAEASDILDRGGMTSHAITEVHAYRVSAYIAAAISPSSIEGVSFNGYEIWNRGWSSAEVATKREAGIRGALHASTGAYHYAFSGLPGVPFLNLDCAKCWTVSGGTMLR